MNFLPTSNLSEVFRHFRATTIRIGWPTAMSSAALLYFGDLKQKAPELFFFLLSIIVTAAIILDIMFLTGKNITTLSEKKKWLIINAVFRFILYVTTSFMIVLQVDSDLESKWGFILACTISGSAAEAIVANSYSWPSFCYGLLICFCFMPVYYFLMLKDPKGFYFGLFCLFYMLMQYPKMRSRFKFFQEFSTLKENAIDEKNQIEKLMDMIPARVSWLRSDLTYVRVNNRMAMAYNLEKERFQDQQYGFSGSPDQYKYRPMLEQFLESPKVSDRITIPITSINGEIRRNEIYAEKLFNQNNEKPDLVIMSIDIEDQLKIREEFEKERAQQQHSARLSSLGEMASGIAHEIKNPLAIISGVNSIISKEILKIPSYNPSKILEKTSQIDKNITRIVKIIESMRKLSRNDQSEIPEWFSLKGTINETLTLIEESLRLNNIKLYSNHESFNVYILGHQIQISQVILNLINNAKDVLNGTSDPFIFINITMEDSQFLKIEIKDNGPGASQPEKLFTPFFTTKDPGSGTGLGLSISKRITENHGGKIIYSKEEDVTIFSILIPKSKCREGDYHQ